MSFGSDLLERSLEVEHPVTVVLLSDEEDEGNARTREQQHSEQNDNEERTIRVLHIDLHQQELSDWTKVPRGSTDDWSVEDSDPFLTSVHVVVDTDEERKYDNNHHGDNDDDEYNNDYDTSTTMSELFRSTGSQVFRDASGADVFLSADDTSNVGIQGQLTRRRFEVVEHETTRKCIVLAPNTQLDSDSEQKEDLVVTVTPDQSAYDVAAALYHSSIKDQGSVLPVVVFKMDSETQTSRNRTTQTGVDQSTMTDDELKEGARKRRRPRQRDPVEDVGGTGKGLGNDDYGEQRSVAFENDDEQEWTQAPETVGRSRPRETSRAAESAQVFSDDGQSMLADVTMTQLVSVGQQTVSHVSTQTPVLIKLDPNGSFWMPQETLLLAGFENISTGTERFFYPLGNRTPPNHHDNQALPRCRGNERSPTRDFSTQTFGQKSRDGIPAETQTSLLFSGNGCLDDDDDESQKNVGIDEIVSRNDTEDRKSRGNHEKKRRSKGHDRRKRLEKEEGGDRSKKTAEIEGGGSSDELKTDLLKLMLHQIRTLKRQVDEVGEDHQKEEVKKETEREKGHGGGHRKHQRSPRGLRVETERHPDDRHRSTKKDAVDGVGKWKKQMERNFVDAPRIGGHDLEGRVSRRRSEERVRLRPNDMNNVNRSRIVRRNDGNYYRTGNAGKGRSPGYSSNVEGILRSLSPSRGQGHLHPSYKYLPTASQGYSTAAPRTQTLSRGHHHHSNHDFQSSRPHPFRPLGTSSPAPPLRPSIRGSPPHLDIRLGGSPSVGGDNARSGSGRRRRKKSLDLEEDERWRENVDPNSKRHLLLSMVGGGGSSSHRHHRI